VSRNRLTIALALSLVALSLSATGCQKMKTKLGLGEVVTAPDPGTPEKAIQDVLKAGRMADEADGWIAFAGLLHSEETASPAGMNEWQTLRYPSLRRKVGYLLLDKAALTYKLMDKREEGQNVRVFVANSQSDAPTPCMVRRDPAQNNAWRVFNSCF
jgi:hypothetical protein